MEDRANPNPPVRNLARELVLMRGILHRLEVEDRANPNPPVRNLAREFQAVPMEAPVVRRVVRPIKRKMRVMKKVDLEKYMVDHCSICIENHQQKDCVMTNCGHQFGALCLEKWVETKQRGNGQVTCPMCVAPTTEITSYRARAKRVPVAIDDDNDSMAVALGR